MVLHSLPIFLALWAVSPSQPLPMHLSEMLVFPEVQGSLLSQSTFPLIWLHPLVIYHLIQKQCSQFFHISQKVDHSISLGLETGTHSPVKNWFHYLAPSETEASLWTSILSFSFLSFRLHIPGPAQLVVFVSGPTMSNKKRQFLFTSSTYSSLQEPLKPCLSLVVLQTCLPLYSFKICMTTGPILQDETRINWAVLLIWKQMALFVHRGTEKKRQLIKQGLGAASSHTSSLVPWELHL